MRTYNQLTEKQRYQIEVLNKAEKKNEIAEIIGVSNIPSLTKQDKTLTITADNGKEVAGHEIMM